MTSSKLEDIVKFQKAFDDRHGWTRGSESSDEEFLKNLQYSIIGLTGEVGEMANFAKKILREKHSGFGLNDKHLAGLKEEVVDVFIYLVILSIVLKMDLAGEYYGKMKKNEERFQKFEKSSN